MTSPRANPKVPLTPMANLRMSPAVSLTALQLANPMTSPRANPKVLLTPMVNLKMFPVASLTTCLSASLTTFLLKWPKSHRSLRIYRLIFLWMCQWASPMMCQWVASPMTFPWLVSRLTCQWDLRRIYPSANLMIFVLKRQKSLQLRQLTSL